MRTHYAGDGIPQPVAPGVFVALPLTATIDYGDHVLEIVVNMTPAGVRAVKVTATAAGQPVTAAMLRIPLGKLVRDAVLAQALPGEGEQRGDSASFTLRSPLTGEQAELARLRGPVDSTLAWVAHFYTLARVVGLPPAKHVQAELGVSRTTASRWIALAREKGLIDGEH